MTGSFDLEAIDVGDIGAFGDGPGPSSAAVLGHEVAEQFAKQALGMSIQTLADRPAHQVGIQAQNRISGWTRGTPDTSAFFIGRNTSNGRITTTFTRRGRSISAVTQVRGGNVVDVWRFGQ